jgi:excisionase family DNA binding protein
MSDSFGSEDTYTPSQVAKILRLTPHRVRQMLNAGELEGEQDEGGRWHVPQRAVHALLEERPRRERGQPGGGESRPALSPGEDWNWELEEELKRLHRELGRLEGRLELTQVAESTLRESLERERKRADQERERAERLELETAQLRDRLAQALVRLEGTQPTIAASEGPSKEPEVLTGEAKAQETPGASQSAQVTKRRPPWWARLLAGR